MRRSVYKFLGIPDGISKGIVGVCFLLTVTPYLAGTDWSIVRIPDLGDGFNTTLKQVGLPLLLVSIALYFPVIRTAGERGAGADAFGLRLRSVKWLHEYKINGNNKDFHGIVTYHVLCTSPHRVGELLPDDAMWFRHGLQYETRGRVAEPDQHPFTLDMSVSSREGTAQEFGGYEVTHLYWRPKITPPLKTKDELVYEVIIETKNSEAAAFTKEGSFAGMRTRFPADELSMRVVAPQGKKLEMKTFFARDTSGQTVEMVKGHSEPKLESDGRNIAWVVKDPVPSISYTVALSIVDP